jgi:hypothetical protein
MADDAQMSEESTLFKRKRNEFFCYAWSAVLTKENLD